MAFVPSDPSQSTYGELASLLLQMTDEMGLHVWTVRTVPGGFEVHDDVAAVLNGEKIFTKDLGEAVAILNAGKTPPPSWSQPLDKVDVEYNPEDGKYYAVIETPDSPPVDEERVQTAIDAPEVHRETIRAWAKENGYEVADKGQLKQSVIDAYYAAH